MRPCGAPMGALFLFAAKGRIRAIQSLQGVRTGNTFSQMPTFSALCTRIWNA